MLMRPVPPHASGPPSPRITAAVEAIIPQQPKLQRPIALVLAFTSPPLDTRPHRRLDVNSLPNGVSAPRHPVTSAAAAASASTAATTCGNCCTDHRPTPRCRHPDRGRGARRVRVRGAPLDAEDRPCVPEVLDRVPFHAALLGDPVFHGSDQEVVADDNTENHRRRVPPRGDNFGDYERAEGHDAKVLPIAERTTACRRVTGGLYRQRHKSNLDAASIISDEHDVEAEEEEEEEEKKEKDEEDEQQQEEAEEEEEKFESRWRSSAESSNSDSVVRVRRDAKAGNPSEGLDVARLPRVARTEPRLPLRKQRRSRRCDERTCGLVFVLYLLALPILCATNGALAFAQTAPLTRAHNSTHRNSSATRNLQGSKDESPSTESRHPYQDYAWEVNQINPWLSACDLAGPAPADLQGSCGPPETPKNCPDACRRSDSRGSRAVDSFFAVVSQAIEYRGVGGEAPETGGRAAPEQCLFYLEESHKTEICRDGFGKESSKRFPTVRENRYRFLSGLRLRHCCEHAALNALASGEGGPLEEVLRGGNGCRIAIEKLLAVDALAARLHCEFGEVLARYDCGQPYSVIYNCTHCKEAYRRWVCSSLVPYFAHDDLPRQKNEGITGTRMGTGMRIRPCRSFCQSVEQRCPYLLPGDRAPAYPTQYAGEPTFLCRDPNIPETGEQASRALHADEECCFHVCSDEDPGLGVCANCTEPQTEIAIRGGDAQRDPSTAPQCELNPGSPSPGQHEQHHHQPTTDIPWQESTSGSSQGKDGRPEVSPSDRKPPSSSSSGTSFCGSGGVGSMSSSASPRIVASLPIIMCAFSAWGILLGVCAIKLASCWMTWMHNDWSVMRRGSKRDDDEMGGCRHVRRSPAAKTINKKLIMSGCNLIGSFTLGIYQILSELSTFGFELLKVKLKRGYYKNGNLYLVLGVTENDQEQQQQQQQSRPPRNFSTRPQRQQRRGKRRRKKKRRRIS